VGEFSGLGFFRKRRDDRSVICCSATIPRIQTHRESERETMKLDVDVLRYLSKDEFRVLTAVEMGMKNVTFLHLS
jgi:hypothetical protein